jgi:hypothetical protein
MSSLRLNPLRAALAGIACLLLLIPSAGRAAKWKDIPPQLLALQSNPYEPGGSALIIFRDGDLRLFYASRSAWYDLEVYARIKIFTDEGKKYASVRIPYYQGQSIKNVKARVILPNGQQTDMPATQVITEQLSPGSGVVKFTIPGVAKGAIIEYQYLRTSENIVLLHTWVFESSDYTLSSTFMATVPKEFQYSGNYVNLTQEPEFSQTKWIDGRGTTYAWTLKNRPGVKEELFSRPAENLYAGIQFIITGYYDGRPPVQRLYDSWDRVANWTDNNYEYTGRRGAIPQVIQELTAGVTDPEEKIARIYDYVQRNIQLEDYTGININGKYSGGILASKKADHVDMNVLLCAMLQEAGFKAELALIATRDGQPFNSGFTSPIQFERWATYVQVAPNKTVWLDPVMTGTPYGILPWQDAGVPALPARGPDLVATPTSSFMNTETRTFTVSLSPEGHIAGSGKISASGQQAIHYRRDFAYAKPDEQEAALLEHLKEQVANVELTEFAYTDQITAAKPVEVSFSFSGNDYATVAGNRLLVNPALFERIDRDFLPATKRENPIQLGAASTVTDEVTIALPAGCTVEQLPSPVSLQSGFGRFLATYQKTPEGILYKRSFSITQPNGSVEAYAELRELFARISEADQQQVVLIQPEGTAATTTGSSDRKE